jgi:hypothetical protein
LHTVYFTCYSPVFDEKKPPRVLTPILHHGNYTRTTCVLCLCIIFFSHGIESILFPCYLSFQKAFMEAELSSTTSRTSTSTSSTPTKVSPISLGEEGLKHIQMPKPFHI